MTRTTLRRAAVLGTLGALTFSTTALGHAEVDKRLPKPGASLSSGPKTVYISFTQQIKSGGSFTVTRGSRTVLRGKNDPRNVKRIIGKSSKRLAKGTYKVSWRATYIDGHRETGSWTFRVR
ncbi:hypothetical protein GKE82_12690 [Conexibacter sp. W3-3-2]|uniref:copper resistance CopC family protein n=1 Tax=Conexibacter sp. W3-3-2 TaxID=2675227 RepID=UPI0012B9080A|nr:copper resistance protein CopC [Conexibacter sp. W3-3-2]MTD45126.1 hypothetical protein [Conexibacter sp. W3-3-2]